jgi:hypothetical protein
MTTIKGTNWSSPKTNMLAGINDLRKALAAGYKAKLIRARNEDCEHPIKEKNEDSDFRNYEFSSGRPSSIDRIKRDQNMSEFQKHLTLNYVNIYGSQEAMKRYYDTGVMGADNLKNMGRSHLVQVDDLIKFLRDNKEYDRANMYERQYRSPEHVNYTQHFFDFYRYKHGSQWAVKEFKRKLWVVQLLDKNEKQPRTPIMVYVLNVIMYPLKYVPKKSVLRMPEYKLVSYRVGSVMNGFKIEFQIPKKFSFK